MAQPFPYVTEYAGMVRDIPRDQLSGGAMFNIVDWIPTILDSPLRKRGGWGYASPALGSSTFIDGGIYANFVAGAKNLAIGGDGNLYSFTSAASSSSIGAAFAISQNPIFHRNLVIIPAASGTTTPKSYDGTTLQTLSGSPPAGIYADVWGDRTLLANGQVSATSYPQRVWFSPAGNPSGTWDTTNAWTDTSGPITAVAALRNAILVYHDGTTERLRGSIPPSATSSGDLTLDTPVFQVGCIDARSLVRWNDFVIWADKFGIYQSDGAALVDLTEKGGFRSYWRSAMSTWTSSYKISAGIQRDLLFISILDGTSLRDTVVCDLNRRVWWRFANFPGRAFWRVGGTAEETYMALGTAGRVAKISSIFSPDSTVKNDADGTAVTPVLETGFMRGWMRMHRRWIQSPGIQTWRALYPSYDIRDSASDSPYFAVSYLTDPASTSYTALTPNMTATTKYTRTRRSIQNHSNVIAFKFAQTNASSDSRLYTLELDALAREGSRLV